MRKGGYFQKGKGCAEVKLIRLFFLIPFAPLFAQDEHIL